MKNLNLPFIASVLAAIAGLVGTVLVPFLSADLTSQIQNILQALSAFLLVIPTWHVTSVAATQAKLKMQASHE